MTNKWLPTPYHHQLIRSDQHPDSYILFYYQASPEAVAPFKRSLGSPVTHDEIGTLFFDEAPFINPWSRHQSRLLSLLGCPGTYHLTRGWTVLASPTTAVTTHHFHTTEDWDAFLYQYTHLPIDPNLITQQFASEHCRHHFFQSPILQASGKKTPSLLTQIQDTHQYCHTLPLIDHAGVLLRAPTKQEQEGTPHTQPEHYVFKTETHNHPTSHHPFIGAATGVGGEIRDLTAIGTGGRPQAGFYGMAISDPRDNTRAQAHLAQAPLGVAYFANEFGRPTLLGFFRVYEQKPQERYYAFDKPILLSGGIGRTQNPIKKKPLNPLFYMIGGPTLPIGIGEALAASTNNNTENIEPHQWSQPELQRTCQYVIEQSQAYLYAVHDLGAGGLINALIEALADYPDQGIDLDWSILSAHTLPQDPIAYLCNESQERFLCIIDQTDEERLLACCQQEHCPATRLGLCHSSPGIRLIAHHQVLWSYQPTPHDHAIPPRQASRLTPPADRTRNLYAFSDLTLTEVGLAVLAHPSVASKHRLMHRFDRSVGGRTAYESVVGPYQVTVGDFALTMDEIGNDTGMAFALGERIPIASTHPCHSVEMAVGEAITNLCGAGIRAIDDIVVSANWMACSAEPTESTALTQAVEHLIHQACHPLHIAIITGKDSLSMRYHHGTERCADAPISLILGAFAPTHVSHARTPVLVPDRDTDLFFIDLAQGRQRLGHSILEQHLDTSLGEPPHVDQWAPLTALPPCLQALRHEEALLAYHDRSDGGLWTTLCEMAIASRCGMQIVLDTICFDIHLSDVDRLGTNPGFLTGRYQDHLFGALFTEELGVVIQTPKNKRKTVGACLRAHGLYQHAHLIGHPDPTHLKLDLYQNARIILSVPLTTLIQHWMTPALPNDSTPHREEVEQHRQQQIPLLTATRTQSRHTSNPSLSHRPRALILRAPGNHGQDELTTVLSYVGFQTDTLTLAMMQQQVPTNLPDLLILPPGFSAGDLPMPGNLWPQMSLQYPAIGAYLKRCFSHAGTLTLGICNGCQALSQLSDWMPTRPQWPQFILNDSQQFESRIVQIDVLPSPSIFLRTLVGESLPLVVAHAYGKASIPTPSHPTSEHVLPCVRFTYDRYPLNPNGSPEGQTGFTTQDGRILGLMPHPERLFLWRQSGLSFLSQERYTPWIEIFDNAAQYAQP